MVVDIKREDAVLTVLALKSYKIKLQDDLINLVGY